MDNEQHLRQTDGWPESWQRLQLVLREEGPFDGVLGFSQACRCSDKAPEGSAIVSCVYQVRVRECKVGFSHSLQGASVAAVLCALQQQRHSSWLRFAILCSGSPSPLAEHRRLHANVGRISLPSLHVYGAGAGDGDRQVGMEESRALAECFEPALQQSIEHSGGHIIPAGKAVLAGFTRFLTRFPD